MSVLKIKNISDLIEKLNNEYKLLLDVIDNIIIIIDNDMKILFINKKGRKLINEEVLMKPCEIMKTANCGTPNCCVQRYLAGNEPLDNICKDGSIEKVTVSRFYDDEGSPQGFIIVATDISSEIYKLALTQSKTSLWQYDVKNHTIEQLFAPEGSTIGILEDNKIYENIPESLIEANIISQHDRKRVRRLCKEIEDGRPETEIELKMRNLQGNERWVKLKCTTIFNNRHEPVKSIGIAEDITDMINLRTKYQIEREYRKAISKDALCYLEVNLSKNKVVTKKIAVNNYLPIYHGQDYGEIVKVLSTSAIYNEQAKLSRELQQEQLLKAFQEGKYRHDYEYQLYCEDDDTYHFVKISIFLIKAENDIYGCGYITDINEYKVENLDLQKKAALDPLTGLYNRKAIETMIKQIIKEFPENEHVLMILDIDNFKAINDNFGHLYGDALLCEIARKIKSKFRNDDLIARLGGDEYLILMKNISNSELALEKAHDLCKLLSGTYGNGNLKTKVTVSIGIALYPACGDTFDTLYHHSDLALYKVKNTNKNGVGLYDMNDHSVAITGEVMAKRSSQKFVDNVGEYIFKILYNSQDLEGTVTTVLELLGMHYQMSQSYTVVKDLTDGKFKVKNYWNLDQKKENEAIALVLDHHMDEYIDSFDEDGILWIDDFKNKKVDPIFKEIYQDTKIKMIIKSLIKNGNDVIGVISMEHETLHRYSREEKEILLTSLAMINTFIVNEYQEAEKNQYFNAIQTVLDLQNNGIYIIDESNYHLIYFNEVIKNTFNNVKIGSCCYKVFRDLDEPCSDCPLKDMKKTDQMYTKIVYNRHLKVQLETTVKRLQWLNGLKVVAITGVDISKYYQTK